MTPRGKRSGEHFGDEERAATKARFLLQLAKNANVAAACRVAGISRQTAHEWKAADESFRAKWNDAIEDACDRLEEVAFRRATGRDPSDMMLKFLLTAHRPEKYAERRQLEHSGTIQTQVSFVNDWRASTTTEKTDDKAEGEA